MGRAIRRFPEPEVTERMFDWVTLPIPGPPWVGWLAGAVALFFAALYVAGPILVWATHRQNPSPRVEVVEPGAVTPASRAWFDRMGPPMADAGFRETQRVVVDQHVPNVVIEVLALSHLDDRIVGVATHVQLLKAELKHLNQLSVEFVTRFEDGSSISTTNTSQLMPYTEIEGKRIFQVPDVQDPTLLLRVHREIVRLEGAGRRAKEAPRACDLADVLGQAFKEMTEAQVRAGWLVPAGDGRYRFTFHAAVVNTWKLCWPVTVVRRARMRARGRAILARCGVHC